MPRPSENDPLRPMLREAENELAQRLQEACAMPDVKEETTGELMRLEETLLDAARAAKQAVSVRRRLRMLGGAGGSGDGSDRGVDATAGAEHEGVDPRGGDRPESRPRLADRNDHQQEPSSVRDFVDENRVEWRVWEVIPGHTRAGQQQQQHHHHQLGDYEAGWLAFEATTTGHRRRLREYPANWNALSNDDLEMLLARGEVVRSARRRVATGDQPDAPTS